MKIHVLTLILGFMLMGPFSKLYSQDLLKVDPVHCKLLNDTLSVKLIQVKIAPGDLLPDHTHPVWMFYVLKGGTLRHYDSNGKYVDIQLTAGMHMQGKEAPVHSDENVGKDDIEFLLIEIKDKS